MSWTAVAIAGGVIGGLLLLLYALAAASGSAEKRAQHLGRRR